MPLFMDVHESLPEGATAKDVADAHAADVRTQDQYGVNYLKYWVDEQGGKVFCLVEAPDADTAIRVHREAHGLVADHILPGSGRLLARRVGCRNSFMQLGR
jgi:uncharacterized protein DUF4242